MANYVDVPIARVAHVADYVVVHGCVYDRGKYVALLVASTVATTVGLAVDMNMAVAITESYPYF